MALREFSDAAGRMWKAWDTRPAPSSLIRPVFAEGWISFACGEEKRRFFPIPAGWEELPTRRLITMLEAATPIGGRPSVESGGEHSAGESEPSEVDDRATVT